MMCTSNVSLLCHHLRRDLFCVAGIAVHGGGIPNQAAERGASPFYLLLLISEKGLRLVRSWGKKTYAPARSSGVVGGYYVLHVLQQAWQNRIGRLAAHNKLLVKLSRTSSIKV